MKESGLWTIIVSLTIALVTVQILNAFFAPDTIPKQILIGASAGIVSITTGKRVLQLACWNMVGHVIDESLLDRLGFTSANGIDTRCNFCDKPVRVELTDPNDDEHDYTIEEL